MIGRVTHALMNPLKMHVTSAKNTLEIYMSIICLKKGYDSTDSQGLSRKSGSIHLHQTDQGIARLLQGRAHSHLRTAHSISCEQDHVASDHPRKAKILQKMIKGSFTYEEERIATLLISPDYELRTCISPYLIHDIFVRTGCFVCEREVGRVRTYYMIYKHVSIMRFHCDCIRLIVRRIIEKQLDAIPGMYKDVRNLLRREIFPLYVAKFRVRQIMQEQIGGAVLRIQEWFTPGTMTLSKQRLMVRFEAMVRHRQWKHKRWLGCYYLHTKEWVVEYIHWFQ